MIAVLDRDLLRCCSRGQAGLATAPPPAVAEARGTAGSPAENARGSRCRPRPTSTPRPPRMFLMTFCSKVSSSSSGAACWAFARPEKATSALQDSAISIPRRPVRPLRMAITRLALRARFMPLRPHSRDRAAPLRRHPGGSRATALIPGDQGALRGGPRIRIHTRVQPPRQRWRHRPG